MKRKSIPLLLTLCGTLLLAGCGLLQREYSTVEAHSAAYYERGSEDILRAESYQDLVNDLMLLVGSHEESGTVWLYDTAEIADISQAAQQACAEVQQETPLGAYALEYMTYTVEAGGRGYTQLQFTAGYRRTAEQLQAIVHATSAAALQDLLQAAVSGGSRELTVEFSGSPCTRGEVQAAIDAAQGQTGHAGETWQVQFYPDTEKPGMVEIILENAK